MKICPRCKQEFPLTTDYFSRCSTGFQSYCKECARLNNREWVQNNREKQKERTMRNRARYKANGPVTTLAEKLCGGCQKLLPLTEEFWNRSTGSSTGFHTRCKECSREKSNTWLNSNPSKRNKYMRDARETLRLECLVAYGGEIPKCVCCGELELSFLCIDHIDGNGNQHKKTIGNNTIFQWLKNNNFPLGFQLLCCNCNWGKHKYGECPHKFD